MMLVVLGRRSKVYDSKSSLQWIVIPLQPSETSTFLKVILFQQYILWLQISMGVAQGMYELH